MKNIPNPYLSATVTSADLVRIQADVSFVDRNLLRTICPEQGIYNFTLANIVIKLCNELRRLQITDYSRENDFRQAIINCRIDLESGLSNRTTSGPVPTADARDDGGTTPGEGNGDTGTKNVESNLPSEDGVEREEGHVDTKRVRDRKTKSKKGVRGV